MSRTTKQTKSVELATSARKSPQASYKMMANFQSRVLVSTCGPFVQMSVCGHRASWDSSGPKLPEGAVLSKTCSPRDACDRFPTQFRIID